MTSVSELRGLAAPRKAISRLDIALGLVGIGFGALSLVYPFGHDQGVHYYVGREWVLHGAVPYRDAFDYKTPGIFVIHALLVWLFGQQMWGIRLAELACVGVLSLLCAEVTRTHERRPGVTGLVALVTYIAYYGYFPFLDTAQCEIWGATFAVAALVVARKAPTHAFFAGVLVALAFLMKPPALLLTLPAVVALFRASKRRVLLAAAGFCAPIAATAAYFASHHALGPMLDVLFGADAQYIVGSRLVDSPGEIFERLVDMVAWFQPFGALLVGSLIVLVVKASAERRRAELPRDALVLGALAIVAIAAQLKFYRYHYGLLIPALVLAIAHVQSRLVPHRPGLAAVVVVALYGISGTASRIWLWDDRAALAYATGRMSRESFAAHFSIPVLAYDDRENEALGEWLREHTAEDEPVLVRGIEPEVYAFARRRAPGRFFWSTPIIDPTRQYRRAEWLAEDERAVATHPRFVVTTADARGPDAVSRFTNLGYARCHTLGKFVVLSRSADDACDRPL